MPKKSNTRRADGRIAVQVYIGTVDGKRKYKTVYGKTQKEAEQKADALRFKLNKGIDITRDKDSFTLWANHWLSIKEVEVSADQYNLLKARVNVFIDFIGCEKINEIQSFELQQILNSIAKQNPTTGKPSAKNTMRSYFQIINAIFENAIDNRIIDFNPARNLKIPNDAPQKQRRSLAQEERQRVIEFKHRAQPAAMLMMFSGLRRGEATALRWSDVDLENHRIIVSRSYNFKQREFKTPKNGKSRIVSIPKILVDYLSSLERNSIYVLTSASGNLMSDTAWKRLFDSYIFDLNLEYGNFSTPHTKFEPHEIPMVIHPFTPHDLRHTFCTMMYEAGIDVLVAKEQMGHSDVKTTLSIYTHLDTLHKERDLQKMDDFLQNYQNASHMQVKKSRNA